jgi:Zn-dependent protease
MAARTDGSIRLFRLAGIDVCLHWSWLLVAFLAIPPGPRRDSSLAWDLAEYLTLFAFVLLHEFGHALVCRQVGGIARRIVLWPLGGLAYVSPPPRPTATLWTATAGPLVNAVLVAPTAGAWLLAYLLGWQTGYPGLYHYLGITALMNAVLLVFNLLPIYPLDGGQVLMALLWFAIGRVRSLLAVSALGLAAGLAAMGVSVLGVLLGAWRRESALVSVLIAAYVVYRAAVGFRQARQLARVLAGPRHLDAACPTCGTPPLAAPLWSCDECGQSFDTFLTQARCPGCGKVFDSTRCLECYQAHPMEAWYPRPPVPEELPRPTTA